MKLIRLLWSQSPFLLAVSVAASIATATLMLLLLSILSSYLTSTGDVKLNWWQFLLTILVTVGMQVLASFSISKLAQQSVHRLRRRMVTVIASARVMQIEAAGRSRLQAALVEDALRVADAMPVIVALIRDVTFIIACLAYLAWLSWLLTASMIGVIILAAVVHQPLQRFGMRRMTHLRATYQRLFAMFGNLVDSIKQLKLSARQWGDVSRAIDDTETQIGRLNTSVLFSFAVANAFAVLVFLLLIQMMIFGQVSELVDRYVAITYTLTMIFLLGPLQGIASSAATMAKARVAIERIDEVNQMLRNQHEQPIGPPATGKNLLVDASGSWSRLDVCAITHVYASAGRDTFTLGPINIGLEPGQLLYVVGGNGTGKTTLAKVLAGLYAPESGELRLDGIAITDANRAWYRAHVGAVFSDFCLFDGLADSEVERYAEGATDLVRKLRLDHVLDPNLGIFAQAATFSSGERRRVALLLSCLDDKPIYVFDEFAADQDPECRALFYEVILPDLSAAGKLVIVITHDVKYLSTADLVLTLERGCPAVLRTNGGLAPLRNPQALLSEI